MKSWAAASREQGALVLTNSGWNDDAQISATVAFPLASGSADAAIVLTLQPGAYTAVVTGANAAGGNVLLEICEVPNR